MSFKQIQEVDFAPIARRMEAEGLPAIAIDTFHYYYRRLAEHRSSLIKGCSLRPAGVLPELETIPDFSAEGQDALKHTVMIKLNGGLGTGMGLDRAKSLLPAKDDLSFLDIVARQILALRDAYKTQTPLVFMNSYNTEQDSLKALTRYPELQDGQGDIPLSFLQHKVPKILPGELTMVDWPADRAKEWCPPGHGDLYPVLVSSGLLDRLLCRGVTYVFVSNVDNLGAVMDLRILGYFAGKKLPFMMEVTARTEADKKGGHLARDREDRLLLRERAQCPAEELDAFQDITRYAYFNTNTLWINLKALKRKLEECSYIVGLPLIVNTKPVDVKDSASPTVYQLETAMGTMISFFPEAEALNVPRSRFAPVKSTEDLLALWSDLFVLNEWSQVVPRRGIGGRVPRITLDPLYYKDIDDFKARFSAGAPSLLQCRSLSIEGDFRFGEHVRVTGDVRLRDNSGRQQMVPAGTRLEGVLDGEA